MAQRVVTTVVSDLSGTEITDGGGETITFAVRGTEYSIDLTAAEAEKFDKALASWTEHATVVGRRRTVGNFKKATAPSAADPEAVRTWAREHGYDVAERGRISAEVRQAYDAAH